TGEEPMTRPFRPAPAHQQLALGAAPNVAVGVIDDARLESAERPAERARGDLAWLTMVGVAAARLGHPPHLDQRKPEALLEARVQLGLDTGAEAELHVVGTLLGRLRLIEEQRRHDAQVMDDGGPRIDHILPPGPGAEALRLGQTVVGEDGAGG